MTFDLCLIDYNKCRNNIQSNRNKILNRKTLHSLVKKLDNDVCHFCINLVHIAFIQFVCHSIFQ